MPVLRKYSTLAAFKGDTFMTSKRISGYVFILIASLLTIAIIGQLPALFGVLIGLFKIFTGNLDNSQIGKVVGHIIYWIVHFVATIALWKYGVKWSKKTVKLNYEKTSK